MQVFTQDSDSYLSVKTTIYSEKALEISLKRRIFTKQ
jgi:hypothetical protein